MPPLIHTGFRLGSPVAAGGRVLVPLVRVFTMAHAGGGAADCMPVALLIREGDTLSFVPLEEGIGQEILAGICGPVPPA